VQQFEENVHSLDIKLSAEQLNALDDIFPGPGGAAPESFAW
jgi:aryl-alcohol dehydrogenase-like predicted oxidoreductase